MTDLSFIGGGSRRPHGRVPDAPGFFGRHDDVTAWRRHLASVFLFVLAAGCASNSGENKRDDRFANMTTEQRMAMCTRIYKDARVACRDGLQDPQASRSMECLSAQLLLDRHCLAPR